MSNEFINKLNKRIQEMEERRKIYSQYGEFELAKSVALRIEGMREATSVLGLIKGDLHE